MKTIKIYDLNKSELDIPTYIYPTLHNIFRWHQIEYQSEGEVYLEYSSNESELKLELVLKAKNYEFENIYVTINSEESDTNIKRLFDTLFDCICGALHYNMIKNKFKQELSFLDKFNNKHREAARNSANTVGNIFTFIYDLEEVKREFWEYLNAFKAKHVYKNGILTSIEMNVLGNYIILKNNK